MISGPKVDLYVGPTKKHYNLPKLLLCHYSDFFDSCFNSGFYETLSQTLYLPEDRIEEFEILLEFMLRGVTPGSITLKEVSAKHPISQFSITPRMMVIKQVLTSFLNERQEVLLFNAALTSSSMQTSTILPKLPKLSMSRSRRHSSATTKVESQLR